MYHVAVGFAHLFKTNPLGKRAAQKGQLFGVVFILVIIRLLRVRILYLSRGYIREIEIEVGRTNVSE